MMFFLLFSVSRAEIVVEGSPRVGEELVLHITDARLADAGGETVRVTHHPGGPHAFERAINITDARGRVRWTPEAGGVAELRAGPQVLRIQVERSELPQTPLALSVLLLVTGLGAMGAGFRRRIG